MRAKTNSPIIGVLTQPIPQTENGDSHKWRDEFERVKNEMFAKLKESDPTFQFEEVYPNNQYIESSHVKFLEAAGARVVPIDYTRDIHQQHYILESINGLYIPGDSKALVQGEDGDYVNAIRKMLKWAQQHNEKESKHFPVLGVGYGFLSLMKSQLNDDWSFTPFNGKGKLQQNLAHNPAHTYMYDQYEKEELEQVFDKIKFFSDLEIGMTMKQMVLHNKILSNIFMPVCSFDDPAKANQNHEMVSAIEGIVYPWFGVGYRIDRQQFSLESTKRDQTDHSREAIMHAQKIANLFIDEARLSDNQFGFVAEEQRYTDLITNNDAHLVELPLIQSNNENTIRTELYLF